MSRMDNALIANGGRFGPSPNSYIANIQDGGQNGFGPLLRNLDANTPVVFLPVQVVVVRAPTFLNYIPDGVRIFKALMETHMTVMDGIDPTYTMDTDGTPVGRDTQMQNVPTRQVRSQITPTCTWPEKIGNVVWNLGRLWFNAMRDVDTQASSMAGIIPSGTRLPPHVSSMYAADIMLIQYDTTYRPENIIGAQYLTNFFPTDIGGPGYQMNTIETHRPDRTFTFNCIVQDNNNTVAAAKAIAALTGLHTVNFQDALPIAEQIEAQLQNMGQNYQFNQLYSQFTNQNGSVTG